MGNKENTKVMWYDVYRELALKLNELDNYNKRKVFFENCINNKRFIELHAWSKNFFDQLKIKTPVGTFDPLHIFASFNGFGMSDNTRKEKINLYFEILGSEKKYENIDFSGCPTPMILALVFVRTRKDWKENAHVNHEEEQKAQGKIWDAFRIVIDNQDYSSINFKGLQQLSGVNLNSFSLLLFWIDSKNFLPLDKNTLALFETNNKILPKDWDKYLEFLKLKDTDIYQIITSMAWEGCSYEFLTDTTKKELEKFGIIKCPKKSLKIIAIKPLEGCNPSFLKGLKEEQLYLFDKAYSIDDNGNITYHKEKDIQLFNQDALQVNINAIVGKNGTGKSTLVELLLAVIHNIGNILKSKKGDCTKLDKIDKLNAELIFETSHMYKVIMTGDTWRVNIYNEEEKKWESLRAKSKMSAFYNILVNYSIHSLSDDWIEPHFQNDCHTDIMIEPLRKKGNIDILEEEERVKKRLIVNLLGLDSENDDNSMRQLTDTYKAKYLIAKDKRTHLGIKYDDHKIENEDKNNYYDLTSISLALQSLSTDPKHKNKRIEQLIPNNFFTDIRLENKVSFSQLSSGEKQKIYSINSIIYHIKEIDRKKKHKHVNLILDEIELYFHPELQRTYISDVIKAIKKVGTENILGINITFITHSPFILSDIPESKILFLEKDSDGLTVPKNIKDNTFGANIHTLLSDSFFMENGLMGEFAKGKINDIKEFYEKAKIEKKTDENVEFYDKHKEKFWQIQSIIGEPFLQRVVKNYLDELELLFSDDNTLIEKELADIEKRKVYLESLKNAKN